MPADHDSARRDPQRDLPRETRTPPPDLPDVAYAELRRLAEHYLGRERVGHTLQPTALVHEAYLKLAQREPDSWTDDTHFRAAAATAMRHILVDHARARRTEKRGGAWLRVTFDASLRATAAPDVDLVALDEALVALATLDARKCRVVELRFFGGLTCAQAATELGIAAKTAEADWYHARAWLRQRLDTDGERADA